jgi:hypothetical protein
LPFEQRAEADDVIIANHTRSSFLCVPPDALEVLDSLAAGRTVGQAQAEYQLRHGVIPDLDDLLEMMEHEGFLRIGANHAVHHAPDDSPTRHYHFENIPVHVARRLFSPAVLLASGVLIALGLLACLADPALLPSPTVLVFDRDQASLLGGVLLISVVGVFVHELAHLVAARAAGISARMGLGNRLWFLVAETEMTGIWMASRRERCLAFLAGPLVDLASAAALVLVLFGNRQHWIQLDLTPVVLIQACLFMYLARLLWQFEFFVPTDFYYVIGTLFGCKNLMQDTQTYLVNQLARVVPGIQTRDQSAVPPGELRVVRWFTVVWVLGRAVAFGTLFWITLPVLMGYGVMLMRGIGGDGQAAGPITEGPLMPLIVVAVQTIGLLVWMRKSFRTRGSVQ